MKNLRRLALISLSMILPLTAASGGTTNINFSDGTIGNLIQLFGPGTFQSGENCTGEFGGGNVGFAVSKGNIPLASGGTTSLTIEFSPLVDVPAGEHLGLIVYSDHYGFITATASQRGEIELALHPWVGAIRTEKANFSPSATSNTSMTLVYDEILNAATVSVAGLGVVASFESGNALTKGDKVFAGIVSTGGNGRIRSFTATGPDVPDFFTTGTCPGEGETPEATKIVGGGFVEEGAPLVLSIVGFENAISYQWRKNGIDLPGENNATFVRSPVTVADAGEYRVLVETESKAFTLSDPIVVKIVAPGSLPVAGGLGLALLSGLVGLAGASMVRRRK